MSKKINSCFLRVSILFCLGSISSPAVAATVLSTWSPSTTDFNSAANWSPAGSPTTTNYAVFSGVANPSLLPQLTANTTIMGLTFTNAAAGYTISTANNSVLTLSSAYSGLITSLQTPAIWAQNTTGTNRISAGLALAAGTSTWNQAKGGTLEVTGNISESGGSRGLSLASGVGTGTTSYYYLSGSNSYTGATTIASGSLLTLGSANVLGTTAGATTINGTIDLNGYSITGEAITGGGKGHDGASGFLVNNSATAASVTGSTLALSSASGNTIGGTGNMTIGSAISGAANNALTKVGIGEITLAGNNTYAGLITVSVGTLTLSGNNSGASSSISVSTGAVLNINSANALGTGSLTTSSSGTTINNTSGSAVINAGTNAITLGSTTTFGTTSSTSANNLDLGAGLVTQNSGLTINMAGNGTTLKMGTLNSTRANTAGSSTGATLTANNTGSGAGNTLMFDGFKLGSAALNNITVQINGSANVVFNGIIENSGSFANGITIANTATTTFAGDNTYTGLTIMNAAAGTLTLSGNNSAASGGVTLTAGTLNINNNNALGSGALSLAGAGATINNTSGSAVVNAGNQAWTWTDGLAFGSSTNTAANNLNLGTGVVTASSSRTIALAGSGTKLTVGAVNITSTSSGRTITASGAGNTLEMGGLTLSASATPVTVTLAGTANIGVTGAIVNGTTPGNGLIVNATGTTTLSGNNTYTGLTTMNASGGTLNLTGNNSSATGGTFLTTGTLNINNANALSTGLLELSAVTGTAYGSSIINNTSGGALTFSGLSGVKWTGVTNAGIQFGTNNSTSANNMDFGTGLVTAASDRSMNIAGTGVTISMGILTASGTAGSYTYKIDGAGNTLDLDGWRISGATTPTQAVQHKISGTANVNIGAIENGTGSFANSAVFMSDGTTRLTGNNTYTGTTEFTGSGTNIISGNNSAAVGNVKIAGDTGKLPVVRLDNVTGISSSSSLIGSSSAAQIGTLDLRAAGNFSLNSFGTISTAGGNMIFTNSSGSQKTLGFTAANNYITTASNGGRTLYNNSANLLVDFDGNVEIGGTSAAAEATTFTGAGSFNVDGNLLDTGTGLTRALRKQGDGTLTLRGSANSYRGSTLVETGTLDLYGNITTSTNIAVSTSGTSASGVRTANATINVLSGATLLNNSTTTVYSRGNLVVNGTAGAVVVESNGLLGGSGTVGAVTLNSGGLLNPGNSPGTLTAASAIVLGGSTYNWQITSLTGTAGTNWDLLSVTGLLDMSGVTSSNKWNLVITADAGFTGWTDTTSYSYVFAQAASVAGFSNVVGTDITSLFNITASGFSNLPNVSSNPSGDFKVEVGPTSGGLTTLKLMAVPEPSTGVLLGFGFGGLVFLRMLRRRNS
jgi:autotransporter-associated beta strand protein